MPDLRARLAALVARWRDIEAGQGVVALRAYLCADELEAALLRESPEAVPPAVVAMNAVCQNPPWEYYGTFDSERCFFCGRDRSVNHDLDLDDEGQHEADCAWWLWRQDAARAAAPQDTPP
jgi:hypothetical protein